ncbi:MAG: AI-2E family transporter [Beijerinckiaceae bacterium]
MTLQRKIGFWLAALAVFILVVYVLRDVLMPFAAALVLAYLLDPLADRLERMGLGRLAATLLILIVFVSLFVAILVVVVPLIGTQAAAFLERLPGFVKRLQTLIAEQGQPILQRIGGEKAMADIQQSLGDVVGKGASWLGTFLSGIWSGGQALMSVLSLLVITPVVTFYLLLDWDRMIAKIDGWVPVAQRSTVRRLASEIDGAVAGFLRGQTLVCLMLGFMYALGLFLVGLNFGIFIGLLAGLISFIPYVGSLIGLVIAIVVAIAQFWPDWVSVLMVLGVFAIGQFIEGNILQPKLVGESVGLHPVWLMFALLAAGSLFGFLGLLLAVPIAAAIGVLVRFALGQYLASPLHGGGSMREPSAESDA